MAKLINIIAIVAVIVLAFKWNTYIGFAMTLIIAVFCAKFIRGKMKIAKANVMYNNGDYAGCAAVYEEIVNSGKASVDERTIYANIALRAGQPEKAIEQMNKVLSFSAAALGLKRRDSAKLTRSMANFKCGNYEEALEEAKEVFFENGYKTIESYCILTYLMIAMYEPVEETVKICEEAYDYDEDNRDILDNLFICYYRMKDYEQAEELADILVRDYPEFVEAYYHGAMMQVRLGNMDKAKEYIKHIDECVFKYMTTVSKEEVKELHDAIEAGQAEANRYLDKLDAEDTRRFKEAASRAEVVKTNKVMTSADDELDMEDEEF